MNEAYKKRDLDAMKIRLKNHARFDKFQTKLKQKKNYQIDKMTKKQFIVYPCITSLEVLADIINRLSFALPQKDNLNIFITVSEALLTHNIFELSVPKYQGSHIGKNKNIYLLNESEGKEHLETDFILLHNIEGLKHISILRKAYKLKIIDKEYFSDREAENLRHLFFSIFTPKEKSELLKISKKNFRAMQEKNKNKEKAYCFTTGPSFDNYSKLKFEKNSFKIICNSIVKNSDFLNYIEGADLIAFADPVFHFGPSIYAEKFREDVIGLVKKYDTYILIPDYNMPLFLTHYPQLKEKLIGIPIGNEFNFPSDEKFYLKGSGNILTLFMIPLATSVSKSISIIGADGRQENEKYFWKHSSSVQYDNEMESVFITHPSFFRDRNYIDYYTTHCNFLEELILYGEKNGHTYSSVTPSYIPALKKRYAPSSIWLKIKKIFFNT